jgi:multicomponent Na+:H+ antiporter subunit D
MEATRSEELSQEESAEEEGRGVRAHPSTPPVLVAVPAVLMLAALVAGVVPGLVPAIEHAAAHFRDHGGYAGAVLFGHRPHYAPVAASHVTASAWIYATASVIGAFAGAAIGLRGHRVLPMRIGDVLRAAHSGHIGDYIAWWTLGMSVLGGLVLWAVTG